VAVSLDAIEQDTVPSMKIIQNQTWKTASGNFRSNGAAECVIIGVSQKTNVQSGESNLSMPNYFNRLNKFEETHRERRGPKTVFAQV
jgi:hypothetical protein